MTPSDQNSSNLLAGGGDYIYHDIVVEQRYFGALTEFMWAIEQHGLNSVESLDALTSVKDCAVAGGIHFG